MRTNSGVVKLGASGGPGSATGTSNAGAYLDGTGKFNFVGDANNFIRFNASGLEINTAKFDVNTDGEITSTGGTIGGFTINSTELKTTNYDPGLKGLLLTSADNGFLEVGNAKIRGTLSTTVFEKETVNAVGGQLQVGNATTITGSGQISATATSIPVENVTGFTGSEVIMAKKVGDTGFSTEYMLITSQSRHNPSSNTDFSGSLNVIRGYSGSASQSQASASLGDSPTPATTLEPGQVLVSTGFWNETTSAGSGYVRINANPNDKDTPFIDIVERTGSSIYDIDLKARLGDLGGISDTINGQAVSGFGLYTDNAFLKGGIVATYGSIGGFNISSTDIFAGNASIGNSGVKIVIGDASGTPKIALSNASADGMSLTGGSDGFYVDGAKNFRVGDANGHRITFDGTDIVVSASDFFLGSKGSDNAYISSSGNNLEISASNFSLTNGNITASNVDLSGKITATTGEVGGFTIDADEIKAGSTLILDADTNSGQIKLGGATSITAGNDGIYMDGTGDFRVGDANGERIAFDKSAGLLIMSSSTFMIGSSADGKAFISASGAGDLEISSSNFHLLGGNITASNVDLTGTISATDGAIGGFYLTSTDLYAGNAALGNANTKIVLGDLTGTPKLALGATADSITLTGGNDGIYMDGGGDFRVGDANGERISYDKSAGLLIMSSSTFMIGSKADGKSFISASGAGDLEISSSNFHLLSGNVTASNVSLSGNVTATSGDIAGWTISGDDIIKTTGNNLKTIQLDSDTPLILIQSGSGGTANFNEIQNGRKRW